MSPGAESGGGGEAAVLSLKIDTGNAAAELTTLEARLQNLANVSGKKESIVSKEESENVRNLQQQVAALSQQVRTLNDENKKFKQGFDSAPAVTGLNNIGKAAGSAADAVARLAKAQSSNASQAIAGNLASTNKLLAERAQAAKLAAEAEERLAAVTASNAAAAAAGNLAATNKLLAERAAKAKLAAEAEAALAKVQASNSAAAQAANLAATNKLLAERAAKAKLAAEAEERLAAVGRSNAAAAQAASLATTNRLLAENAAKALAAAQAQDRLTQSMLANAAAAKANSAALTSRLAAEREARNSALESSNLANIAAAQAASARNSAQAGSRGFDPFLTGGARSVQAVVNTPTADPKAVAAVADGHSRVAKEATASASALGRWSKEAYQQHALARGLAGSLGQLWLTYGSLGPLLTGAAIGATVRSAITAGKEFEYQLTFVKALGGESAAAVERLGTAAKELATQGMFGPTEIANGLRILTQAGLTANEALLAIPHTLDLATVGEMKMEDAAVTLIGVMTAFRKSIYEISQVGDVFAKAAAVSQVSVADMTESMKTASVVGEQYGASMEDTATALVLLGQLNIRGTAAGTSLRNMLKELYTPGKEAAAVMKQLGLETFDAQGKMKSFPEIIYQLKDILTQFDKESQVNILQNLFGERGAKEAIAMLALTRDEYNKLKEEVGGSSGFMRKVAAELEETTSGSLSKAFNTLKVTMIEAFESTKGPVADLAKNLQSLFASEGLKSATAGLVSALTGVVDAVTMMAPLFSGLLSVIGALAQPLTIAAAAWGAWKLAAMAAGAVASGLGVALGGASTAMITLGAATRAVALTNVGTQLASMTAVAAGTASAVGGTATAVGVLGSAFRAMLGPVGLAVSAVAAFSYWLGTTTSASTATLISGIDDMTGAMQRLADRTRSANEALLDQMRAKGLLSGTATAAADAEISTLEMQRNRIAQEAQKRGISNWAGRQEGMSYADQREVAEIDARLAKLRQAKKDAEFQQTLYEDRIDSLRLADQIERNRNDSRLATGQRNLGRESFISAGAEAEDPYKARRDAINKSFEDYAKDLDKNTEEYRKLVASRDQQLKAIDEEASRNIRTPTKGGPFDGLNASIQEFRTKVKDAKDSLREDLSDIKEMFSDGLIGSFSMQNQKEDAITAKYDEIFKGFDAYKRTPGLSQTDLAKIAEDEAAAIREANKELRDARNEGAEIRRGMVEDISDLQVEVGLAAQDAGGAWLKGQGREYVKYLETMRADMADISGKMFDPSASLSPEKLAKFREQLNTLEKMYGDLSTAVQEKLKLIDIASSLNKAKLELDKFNRGLDKLMKADSDGGLFAVLLGSSRDIEQWKNTMLPKLQRALSEIRAKIASATSSEERDSLIADADQIEEEIRKGLEASSPTLQRWSDEMGSALANALVYGFAEGESPAKLFASMLKKELANALSSVFSKAINVGLNVVMNMVGGGIQSMMGGGVAGGVAGAANTASGIGNAMSLGNSVMGMFSGGIGIGYQTFAMSGIGQALGLSNAASFIGPATAQGVGGLGLTGMGSAIGTAIPYIGLALGAISLLSGAFKKPSNKAAWGEVDLSSGSLSGLGNMTGEKQAPQETLDARDAILKSLGAFGSYARADGTVRIDVGGRDGIQAAINGGEMKSYGKDPDKAMMEIMEEILKSSALDDATIARWEDLKTAIDGSSRSAADMIDVMGLISGGATDMQIEMAQLMKRENESLGQSYARLAHYLGITKDANDLWTEAQRRLQDSFADLNITMPTSIEGFRELIGSIDLSTEAGQEFYKSIMDLAPAFFELADAVEAVRTTIGNLADQTIEDMYRMTLSDKEEYAYNDSQIAANRDKYAELTNPAEIQANFEKNLKLITDSFSLLPEDMQKALYPQFQRAIEEEEKLANERLSIVDPNYTPVVSDDANGAGGSSADAVAQAITASLGPVATLMNGAGNAQLQAADRFAAAAAAIPSSIVVSNNVNLVTPEVGR